MNSVKGLDAINFESSSAKNRLLIIASYTVSKHFFSIQWILSLVLQTIPAVGTGGADFLL